MLSLHEIIEDMVGGVEDMVGGGGYGGGVEDMVGEWRIWWGGVEDMVGGGGYGGGGVEDIVGNGGYGGGVEDMVGGEWRIWWGEWRIHSRSLMDQDILSSWCSCISAKWRFIVRRRSHLRPSHVFLSSPDLKETALH